MINLQVKPEPLGLFLSLVGHRLPLDDFAERWYDPPPGGILPAWLAEILYF